MNGYGDPGTLLATVSVAQDQGAQGLSSKALRGQITCLLHVKYAAPLTRVTLCTLTNLPTILRVDIMHSFQAPMYEDQIATERLLSSPPGSGKYELFSVFCSFLPQQYPSPTINTHWASSETQSRPAIDTYSVSHYCCYFATLGE